MTISEWVTSNKKFLAECLAVIVVTALAGITIEKLTLQNETREAKASYLTEAAVFGAKTDVELYSAINMARSLAVMLELNPSMSQAEYSSIATKLAEDNPSVLNIAAAPDLVVKLVHPYESNKSVLGLDYRKNPDQYGPVLQLLETRLPILAGPVDLIQGGQGFILRSGIFNEQAAPSSPSIAGMMSIVIEKNTLLQRVGLMDQNDTRLVAVRGDDSKGKEGRVFFGDPAVFESDPVLVEVDFPFGSWQIGIVPTNGWPATSSWFASILAAFIFINLVSILVLFSLNFLQKAKESAEQKLNTAIDTIDDGFVLYDADDRLVHCNAKYREIYSHSAEAMYPGNSFENILRLGLENNQYADAIGREEEWLAERLENHANATETVEQKLADGRWLKISERKLPDGSTVGFRVDITELMNAKKAAEASSEAKSRFLNAVSHELRTPLSIMLGYIAFLENPSKLTSVKNTQKSNDKAGTDTWTQDQVELTFNEITNFAARTRSAGEQLRGMVEKILEVSSEARDEADDEMGFLRIGQVVGPVAERFREEAQEKGLNYSVTVKEAGLFGNASQVDIALNCLIENAITHTQTGSIKVHAKPDKETVKIVVQDTGAGMTPDQVKRASRSFEKIDGPQSEKPGSLGLGLTIVKKIAATHGGSLSITSKPDEGTTATITFKRMEPIRKNSLGRNTIRTKFEQHVLQ